MGRVRRDPAQGLARRPEQDIVDQWLVLEGDDRDLVRHGEDNVQVGYVEQLRFPVRKPASAGERLALGTIPVTTGVVRDALMAASIAAFDVAAEGSGRQSSIARMA